MNRRAFIGFAIGPAGVGLLSAISLPIMTWIFPTETIGQFSMLQVAIGLFLVLCCLGLDQAYGREYHEADHRPTLFLNATAPGLVLLVTALLAVMLVNPTLLSRLLYDTGSVELGVVTCLCLVAAYLTRFLSLILRMQNRGFSYSFSQMTSKFVLLLIVLGYALFVEARNFTMLLLAQAVAWCATLLIFAWSTRGDWWLALQAKLEWVRLKGLLVFGFPLIFASLASWGVAMLDRVFLRSMSTYEELAVYSVAASIAAGVNVLAGVLNTIWAPMVYEWVAKNADLQRVDSIARQTAVIVFLIVCLAGGLSWILAYALPSSYHKVSFLVVACMVAPLFYMLSEVTGIGVAVSRRTIFSLGASGAAVLLDIVLCLLLVPRAGALGAVTATACSFWLFFVLRTEFSVITWRRFRRSKIHIYGLLCLVLALGYAALGHEVPLVAVAAWWLTLLVTAWIERSTLVTIWHSCRQYARTASIKEVAQP